MIDIESFTGDRVYIDANLFIYAVEGYRKYSALCDAIFRSIEEMKIHAVTSELTLAEVLVHPQRNNDVWAIAKYEDLIQSRYDLRVTPITRDILRTASKCRATMGLKLPDAIHAATAQLVGSEFIFTADQNFRAPSPIQVVTLDEMLQA